MKTLCATSKRIGSDGIERTAIVVDPNAWFDLVDHRGRLIGRVLVTLKDGTAEVEVATGERKNSPRSSSVFRYIKVTP